MSIALIRCRGKCKQKKSVACFQPNDIKRAHPICRACRKAYREPSTGRDRGWYWRRESNTLCPGSAMAMEKLGAP